jgi:hypothetical protein
MKLPNYRRIFSSDFDAQYKELLDKLSGTINSGVEVLYEALNGRLNFSDNFAATVTSFSVTVDSNGTPTGTTSFKLANTQKVTGLLIASCTDDNSSVLYPPGAPFISFTQSAQSITVNNIRGLTAGRSYTIGVIALN